ncbi:hypothetical protein PG985_010416 [Apiospora marii]|uniref:Uncharacterized protein n=1 Tax=Apiospora marii TaxID=335849 RepID=A0ABR1S0N6_9PEZI
MSASGSTNDNNSGGNGDKEQPSDRPFSLDDIIAAGKKKKLDVKPNISPTPSSALDQLIENFWQEIIMLDTDQQACFMDMESLPFGLLSIFGVPGAGKTRLCLLIVVMCC